MLVIGGGITLLTLSQKSSKRTSGSPAGTQETPTQEPPTAAPIPPMGTTLYTYSGHPTTAVAWSPNGKRIASGSEDHTVQVWDALDVTNSFVYRGHSDAVDAVRWSPDGQRIASASKNVLVWDATSGKTIFIYSTSGAPMAWSLDGTRIASSVNKIVQVWAAA